jgi:hypothetical protein
LTSRNLDRKEGDWLFYTINMGDFDCPAPEDMNQLLWEVKGGTSSNVAMCLDDVRINRGGGGDGGKVDSTKAVSGRK